MKNFLILHYGFEKPSPDDMAAWKRWFESIEDIQLDRGGLRDGREITQSGSSDLPFGRHAVTGYTIIEAEDLDEAEKKAKACPVVDSTKVYEISRG